MPSKEVVGHPSRQLQTGMRPDPERHESYFMIEPQTSIPVKVAVPCRHRCMQPLQVQMALQLNVKLEPIPDMEYVFKVGGRVAAPPQSLPTVYLPIFWFHSSAALPENMAAPLLILLNMPNILVLLTPTPTHKLVPCNADTYEPLLPR